MKKVTEILHDEYQIEGRPGQKTDCPFCGSQNFSIKTDDTLGKCFSPTCGKFIRLGVELDKDEKAVIEAISALHLECKKFLLRLELKCEEKGPLQYLTQERRIHRQVVEDAPIGALPATCTTARTFEDLALALREKFDELKAKNEERGLRKPAQKKCELLDICVPAMEKFAAVLKSGTLEGYIGFFYQDELHAFRSIRFRKPFSRKFYSFKPFQRGGVFGNSMFFQEEQNRGAIVVEGEFNLLQLQSLSVRYAEMKKTVPFYQHVVAVGGVLTTDVETLKRLHIQGDCTDAKDEDSDDFV